MEELSLLDFADWELVGDPHKHPVNANWKVTLDTYRENYHFNYLHRNTLAGYAYGGVLTFDAFGPHVRNASAIRTIDEIRNQPGGRVGRPVPAFQLPVLAVSQRVPELRSAATSSCGRSSRWAPIAPRCCTWPISGPGCPSEESAKLAEMAPWICQAVVDGEDFWVAGRTEPGIQTGLVDTAVFGRNEPAPQHLHRGFLAALAEEPTGLSGVADAYAGRPERRPGRA